MQYHGLLVCSNVQTIEYLSTPAQPFIEGEGIQEEKRLGTELTSYFHNRKYTSDHNLGNFWMKKQKEGDVISARDRR